MPESPIRCGWVSQDSLYQRYHDEEWGVPVYDDRVLFEFLVLESAQAGLSWITILKRRENYRAAFALFDPDKVAAFQEQDLERLMGDAGIIRNRKKIEAAINNANRFLEIQSSHGSFSNYIWGFVGGNPRMNHWAGLKDVPAITPESEALAKDLKQRGFRFLGPTICYAHMQATGMVNDHTLDCFRHDELMQSP